MNVFKKGVDRFMEEKFSHMLQAMMGKCKLLILEVGSL